MPTISNSRLTITGNPWLGPVTIAVTYTATFSAVETYLAERGLSFAERIQIIGDDPGTVSDVVIYAFPPAPITLTAGQTTVQRSRQATVPGAALNEDPATGSPFPIPQPDEILARVELAYVGLSNGPATAESPVVTVNR
jgi:hypothetical protein